MSHLDPDQIALLALGEPVATSAEAAHLVACPACGRELDEMRRAAGVARATVDDDGIEAPPARVWSAIADELGLAAAAAPSLAGVAAPPVATPPPTPRRRPRTAWILAAVVAIVVAAALGTWAAVARSAPTVVAEASLVAFPAHPDAAGTADVQESRRGARTLVVSLDGAATRQEYHEVWLIRSDAAALISLGILTGDRGTFAIPDGVDLAEYNLVDISAEPLDGDPAHSGDSIVRGKLGFG